VALKEDALSVLYE